MSLDAVEYVTRMAASGHMLGNYPRHRAKRGLTGKGPLWRSS